MSSFEIYNQLIDLIKSISAGVEAYADADTAKDMVAREMAADALRYRIENLTKLAAPTEQSFARELDVVPTLAADIAPKRVTQINDKLEPLRKALLSEVLRSSLES
jgi:hypothetical protein